MLTHPGSEILAHAHVREFAVAVEEAVDARRGRNVRQGIGRQVGWPPGCASPSTGFGVHVRGMVAPQNREQFRGGGGVAPGAVVGFVVDAEEVAERPQAVSLRPIEPLAGHAHRAEPAGVVVEPGGLEAGLEMPEVEGDVVGHEDGVSKKSVEVLGKVGEFRGVRHHGVVDAREPGDAGGNGPGGPDEAHPAVQFAPAIVQDGCHLGDVVPGRGAAIGLDVDDGVGGGGGCGHGAKDGGGSAVEVRC